MIILTMVEQNETNNVHCNRNRRRDKVQALLEYKFRKCVRQGLHPGWLFERDDLFDRERLREFDAVLRAACVDICKGDGTAADYHASRICNPGLLPPPLDPRKTLFVPQATPPCLLPQGTSSIRLCPLPRFFGWVVPHVLCASSAPRGPEDIRLMADHTTLDIRTIVTLTEEAPLPYSWFGERHQQQQQGHKNVMRNVFLPVKNGGAPSFEQMDQFVFMMKMNAAQPDAGAVCIHCGGGKGRTGVFVACYFVAFGTVDATIKDVDDGSPVAMGAAEAIDVTRALRPGSLETREQEEFVHAYARHRWKRWAMMQRCESTAADASMAARLTNAPAVDVQGEHALSVFLSRRDRQKVLLLLLCGVPGSGKSSFVDALLSSVSASADSNRDDNRDPSFASFAITVNVCSQDALGSKTALRQCLRECAGKKMSPNDARFRIIIIDRCNVNRESRIEMVEAFCSDANHEQRQPFLLHTACVWFDIPPAVCAASANSRVSHPTLRPGKAERVIEAMAAQFEPPMLRSAQHRLTDAPFDTIVTVRKQADEAIREAIRYLIPTTTTHGKISGAERENEEDKSHVFQRFPRTKHLVNLGAASSDDHTCNAQEAVAFFSTPFPEKRTRFVIQEKVDGANLGLSIDPATLRICARNRSHYVTSMSHVQFRGLDSWIHEKTPCLWHALTEDGSVAPGMRILYGEWLALRHSVPYSNLPDVFLAFDMYDVEANKFLSSKALQGILRHTSICSVPTILSWEEQEEVRPKQRIRDLVSLAERGVTRFSTGSASSSDDAAKPQNLEGVYVRREQEDERDTGRFWLRDRAKIVRSDFIRPDERGTHWSKRRIIPNIISANKHTYANTEESSNERHHQHHQAGRHPPSSRLRVRMHQGFTCCTGDCVDGIAQRGLDSLGRKQGLRCQLDQSRRKHPYHITLVDKNEYRGAIQGDEGKEEHLRRWIEVYNEKVADSTTPNAEFLELGNAVLGTFAFVALVWTEGDRLRHALGLPPKDFHVTLSLDVDHGAASRPGKMYASAFLSSLPDATFLKRDIDTDDDEEEKKEKKEENVKRIISFVKSTRWHPVLVPIMRSALAYSRACMCMADEHTFWELSKHHQTADTDADDDVTEMTILSLPSLRAMTHSCWWWRWCDKKEFVARVCELRGREWPTAWIRAADMLFDDGEYEGAKLSYLVANKYNR